MVEFLLPLSLPKGRYSEHFKKVFLEGLKSFSQGKAILNTLKTELYDFMSVVKITQTSKVTPSLKVLRIKLYNVKLKF